MAFNSSKHSTEKVSGTSWHGFHWLGLDFYFMHQLKIIYLIIKSPNLQYVIYWHLLANSLSYQHMETPSLLKLLKSFYNKGFSAIFSWHCCSLSSPESVKFQCHWLAHQVSTSRNYHFLVYPDIYFSGKCSWICISHSVEFMLLWMDLLFAKNYVDDSIQSSIMSA